MKALTRVRSGFAVEQRGAKSNWIKEVGKDDETWRLRPSVKYERAKVRAREKKRRERSRKGGRKEGRIWRGRERGREGAREGGMEENQTYNENIIM